MTATVQTPAGDTWDLGNLAATWKFVSFYRDSTMAAGTYIVRYHRSEAAAAKGQWDSAEQRRVLVLAGHAPVVRG